MDTIDPDRTLAELVLARPGLAGRFDELGLDYCCGGGATLADAVDAAGLDPTATIAELESVPPESSQAPSGADLGELVDWIETTHHAFLRGVLPRLAMLADKVAGVHGGNHPELAEVAALVHALRADLEPHLVKEERVLFPMVRELAAATSAPAFHCGALSNPISVMLREHDAVGAMLARLRDLTDGYTVPVDGCGSYDALVTGLAELEADTHRHVHVENNVLFPAVLAAEDELAARDGVRDEGGEAPCWAHLIDPS